MPNINPGKIELRGVRKAFGDCVALQDISFEVKRGTIHAIVGENGAGKSTAMKVLYGQYEPDQGEILLDGKTVRWGTPADAIAAGFGMVHQHFMLAASHDAVDNVLLSAGGSAFEWLGRARARERIRQLMKDFHLEVRLDLAVQDLSVGEQQRIEILKLLYRDSHVMILDEPTAVLAPSEIEALFATLRGMAKQGKTVLIITHKLKEVIAVASEVTVFRAGRVTGQRSLEGATVKELAAMMVGREIALDDKSVRAPARPEVVLELLHATPVKKLARLGATSFRLHAGEILGIAGVEGNGQSELIKLLLDPSARLASGAIHLNGADVSGRSAGLLRENAGLAVFPEDRLREALLLGDSVEDNFLLGHQRAPRYRRILAFLDRAELRLETEKAIRDFDVRPANPLALVGSLSGGNQQKLVVARELSVPPKFLLAAQPTRGVDIGAIEAIHARILGLRAAGSGILLISSELDEVMKLSDRILVIYRGKVLDAFTREQFDERRIGLLMAGGHA